MFLSNVPQPLKVQGMGLKMKMIVSIYTEFNNIKAYMTWIVHEFKTLLQPLFDLKYHHVTGYYSFLQHIGPQNANRAFEDALVSYMSFLCNQSNMNSV